MKSSKKHSAHITIHESHPHHTKAAHHAEIDSHESHPHHTVAHNSVHHVEGVHEKESGESKAIMANEVEA